MHTRKKRTVNHKLREIQLMLHQMNDDGLILFSHCQNMVNEIQEYKYPLEELE